MAVNIFDLGKKSNTFRRKMELGEFVERKALGYLYGKGTPFFTCLKKQFL